MTLDLKKVDGVTIQQNHKATCHCGAVEMELNLPNGLVNVRRCDCSLCRRRGAIMASVPLSDIHILRGADVLTLYQFNTNTSFVADVVPTPTISAGLIRRNMGLMSPALRVLIL